MYYTIHYEMVLCIRWSSKDRNKLLPHVTYQNDMEEKSLQHSEKDAQELLEEHA